MLPLPPSAAPIPCRALTAAGAPCRRGADYLVPVAGRHVPLCGYHAKVSRRSPVALWELEATGPDQVDGPPLDGGAGRGS